MDQIVNTSDHLAHVILIALCEDPATLAKALPLVGQLELRQLQGALNGTKRKADDAPLLVCRQCDQVFDEQQNADGACAYHEGELEPDYDGDFWADTDQEEIDTPENRRDYPEGFFWNCCGKHGDENEPCVVGRHFPAPGQGAKRGRHEDNTDSGTEDHSEEDGHSEDGLGEDDWDPNDPDNPYILDTEDEEAKDEEEETETNAVLGYPQGIREEDDYAENDDVKDEDSGSEDSEDEDDDGEAEDVHDEVQDKHDGVDLEDEEGVDP